MSGDNQGDAKNEDLITIFLYNKVNVGGHDDTEYIKSEIQALIDRIAESKDAMFERRKDVGVGILFGGNIYADGRVEELKVIQLLMDAFESYVLGKYYAAVAVSGMAAERLVYDFIELLPIKFGEQNLTLEAKKELMYIQYSKLLLTLKSIGVFNDNEFKILNQINIIRNNHVHPKMENVEQDATKIVKLLCQLLELKLSMFRFYDVVDGRFQLKPEYRNE